MFRKYAAHAALFALACAGAALPAQAAKYEATFTLPFEAQWGKTHLQPGEYKVMVDTAFNIPVFHLTGNGQTAAIMGSTIEYTSLTGLHSQLALTDVNGTPVVTKLTVPSSGKIFWFAVPKELKGEGAGVAAMKKVVVPVSSAQ